MQISAASPSPNFHSGRSYIKKYSVYFLSVCVNIPCKIYCMGLELKWSLKKCIRIIKVY